MKTLALVVGLAALSCSAVDPPVQTARQSVLTENSLITNSLITNSLITNSLITNSLITNSLITNSLITNSLITNSLITNAIRPDGLNEGELTRQFLKYLYSCALPEGASLPLVINGVDYGTLHGAVGLAPEWGQPGGKCDEHCQRWVTACLLARTNFWGVPIQISLRGPHPALTPTAAEMAAYPNREGSYFGNLFAYGAVAATAVPGNQAPPGYDDHTDLYACSGPASSVPQLTHRFCSSVSAGACLFGVYHPCVDATPSACERLDPSDGAALGCYAGPLDVVAGQRQGPRFDEVITVYVKTPLSICGDDICTGDETAATCRDCSTGWAQKVGFSKDPLQGQTGPGFLVSPKGRLTVLLRGENEVLVGGQREKFPGLGGLVLAELDRKGQLSWSRTVATWPLPTPGDWQLHGAAVSHLGTDAQGDLYLAGAASADVTWRGGAAPAASAAAFLAKLSPTGELRWVRNGGPGTWFDGYMGVTPDGVVLSGGGGWSWPSPNGDLVATGPDGDVIWTKPHDVVPSAVEEVTDSGQVILSGTNGGLLRYTPGLGALKAVAVPPGWGWAFGRDGSLAQVVDGTISRYSPADELIWTWRPDPPRPPAVTPGAGQLYVNGQGEVLAVSQLGGYTTLQVGNEFFQGAVGEDASVVWKLGAHGEVRWAKRLDGQVDAAGLDDEGTAYLLGHFQRSGVFDGWLLERDALASEDVGAMFLVAIPDGAP
jgi:hypothetical protein